MGTGNIPLVHLFTYISHKEDTIMIKINDQFTTNLGTELQIFKWEKKNFGLITFEL